MDSIESIDITSPDHDFSDSSVSYILKGPSPSPGPRDMPAVVETLYQSQPCADSLRLPELHVLGGKIVCEPVRGSVPECPSSQSAFFGAWCHAFRRL